MTRVYTEKEQQMIRQSPDKAAGCWAVKEAVVKAFGTGFSNILPREIEVLRDELGKPYVNLYGNAKEQAEKLGVEHIFVSISHTGDMVSAVAVGETKE